MNENKFCIYLNSFVGQFKLTNKELAHLLNTSIPTIEGWRNGTNQPTPILQKKIVEILESFVCKECVGIGELFVGCFYCDRELEHNHCDSYYVKCKTCDGRGICI